MGKNEKPYAFSRLVSLSLGAALLFGLIWVLKYLSDVLIPFAVAFLLAYLINPLVLLIQKKVPRRLPAVILGLLTIIVLAVLLTWLVVPLIVEEIGQMGRVLSKVVDDSQIADRASRRLPPDLWNTIKDYASREEIRAFFQTENFWKIVEKIGQKVLPGVWGVITGTATFIMGLFGLALIGLYLIFLLLDYQKVKDEWTDLIPPAHREGVVTFIEEFDAAMRRYFRAQAAVASIVGILLALGFTIIGLPLGLLLGLFTGLLNMVPYLQIIAIPPALFLATIQALESGTSIWAAMGLTCLVFAVVQAIQDGFLVPKIMGDVTGLSPAMILLSLSIWGKFLGILGLLIALPMTCLILAYYKRFWTTSAGSPPMASDA